MNVRGQFEAQLALPVAAQFRRSSHEDVRILLLGALLLLVGSDGKNVARVRVKNDTGLLISQVTIGSPFSEAQIVTFTGLAPDARTESMVVTNFVYPCSDWTIDSTRYQRNVKQMHSPARRRWAGVTTRLLSV